MGRRTTYQPPTLHQTNKQTNKQTNTKNSNWIIHLSARPATLKILEEKRKTYNKIQTQARVSEKFSIAQERERGDK